MPLFIQYLCQLKVGAVINLPNLRELFGKEKGSSWHSPEHSPCVVEGTPPDDSRTVRNLE